ncbi:MAG: hypothetical protein O7A98_10105 [Acidobacteria bacterium]|nr:hypothetical protein [Acidobacteriota bacterium]
MKKRDIDTLIREALSHEDQEFLDSLEEPSLSEQVTYLFRGRWRWLNALSIAVAMILLVVGVYCLVEFMSTDEVPAMLRWGGGALFCLLGTSYIKLWAWLELERHAVTREIKRLELQVAHLAAAWEGNR